MIGLPSWVRSEKPDSCFILINAASVEIAATAKRSRNDKTNDKTIVKAPVRASESVLYGQTEEVAFEIVSAVS